MTFGSFPDSATLEGPPGRTMLTAWQDLPPADTSLGTYLAKGAGLGGWTLSENHLYDPWGILWRGDGEREQPATRAGTETVSYPNCDATIRIASLSDGSLYVAGYGSEGGGYPCFGLGPGNTTGLYTSDIWKLNPTTGRPVVIFSNTSLPAAENPGYRPISAIASGPDDSAYFSPVADPGSPVYVDRVSAGGVWVQSWKVDEVAPLGRVRAIAVGPDGTPYCLLHTGSCLQLLKLEPDGRKSLVAGGDCTNLVASGDGGPASAATFKSTSAAANTPVADLAVGQDGSVYVTNQSECRVRRIKPDGIIDTVAGTICPSDGAHAGDGGLATAATIKPTAIAIGWDDTGRVKCQAAGATARAAGRSRARASASCAMA
jgi:hypothetical protein